MGLVKRGLVNLGRQKEFLTGKARVARTGLAGLDLKLPGGKEAQAFERFLPGNLLLGGKKGDSIC